MNKTPLAELSHRQKKLYQQLGSDSIAILFNDPEVHRSGDSEYPYRPSSNFYYLTGFEEPNAIAVFIPHHAGGEYILFHLPRDLNMEQWTGKRFDSEEICKDYGADQTFSSVAAENQLAQLCIGKQKLFYAFENDRANLFIQKILKKLMPHSRTRSQAPQSLKNISPIIQQSRLYKSTHEIALMRKAAEITVEGHKKAITACQPGLYEYQLEAELNYCFMHSGAKFCAYPSIISGNNSCTLHYNRNDALINNGDLVLIDAGAEYGYYASDVTRTFPANGKFTSPQRIIYEIVLTAQQAAIAEIKPGTAWNKAQEVILKVITEGLIEIGILKGNVSDLIEKKTYLPFYPHNSGHWLGLDTHDPNDYQVNDQWRLLEPNMVLTVEPGIYIPANCENVDPQWRGIGVRIEDDLLVTQDGHEILSGALPKSVEGIEEMMG